MPKMSIYTKNPLLSMKNPNISSSFQEVPALGLELPIHMMWKEQIYLNNSSNCFNIPTFPLPQTCTYSSMLLLLK